MKNLKNYSKTVLAIFGFLLMSATTFGQAAKVIEMKGTDQMKFTVESIQATPGQKITVKLSNDSKFPANAMSHNFVLLNANVDAAAFDKAGMSHATTDYIDPKLKSQMIAHTSMVAGGKSAEVTFNAPKVAGRYVYICTFPGHFGAGMKGVLIVK